MHESQQKKIRLAIVENNFTIGGVQRLVLDQIKALDQDRFDLLLITLTQLDMPDFYDLLPPYVRVKRLQFVSWKNVGSWLALLKILREYRPDIVKSSMYFSNTIVRVLKPIVRYKLITAEHNTNDGKGWLQHTINHLLNRCSYTTIVDSNMVADYLAQTERSPRSRYTVIHNGVDVDAVETSWSKLATNRDLLRRTHGILPHEKLFLTIGRMVRQKNHIRMVEAMAVLLKSHPDCKLLIVGDGGLKPQVEKRIMELGIGEMVILLPSQTDIHQFYVMSDITLLSSDHEGFCIAAMEGLAFGLPLVATRVAGVVEYLQDGKNGFFAEKDANDLADKMGKAVNLSSEELKQFQAAARQTASNYSIKKYGEKFNELIQKCLSS